MLRKNQNTDKFWQKSYPISDLKLIMDAVGSAPDVYLSQASFIRPSRKISNFNNIGCAFVDIDCYKLGFTPSSAFVDDLLDRAGFAGLPLPSYVVFSGRGIYLKWFFKASITSTQLCKWNALQRVLILLYQNFGSDIAARDGARVLRVIGSTNSKSDGARVGTTWAKKERYDFDELCKTAAGVASDFLSLKDNDASNAAKTEIKKQQSKILRLQSGELTAREAAVEQKSVIAHLNKYAAINTPIMLRNLSLDSLNWSRFIDLRDLCLMRGGVMPGSRDMTLFWMGVFLGHSGVVTSENFTNEMQYLSSGFPGSDFKPLEDGSMNTLLSKIKAYERGEKVHYQGSQYCSLYTASNQFLIDAFEISDSEQQKLSTIIGSNEKLRRSDAKAPGRSENRQKRIQWRLQAQELMQASLDQGIAPNITKIAASVNVHKAQVSRLFSKVKSGQINIESIGKDHTAIESTPTDTPTNGKKQRIQRKHVVSPTDIAKDISSPKDDGVDSHKQLTNHKTQQMSRPVHVIGLALNNVFDVGVHTQICSGLASLTLTTQSSNDDSFNATPPVKTATLESLSFADSPAVAIFALSKVNIGITAVEKESEPVTESQQRGCSAVADVLAVEGNEKENDCDEQGSSDVHARQRGMLRGLEVFAKNFDAKTNPATSMQAQTHPFAQRGDLSPYHVANVAASKDDVANVATNSGNPSKAKSYLVSSKTLPPSTPITLPDEILYAKEIQHAQDLQLRANSQSEIDEAILKAQACTNAARAGLLWCRVHLLEKQHLQKHGMLRDSIVHNTDGSTTAVRYNEQIAESLLNHPKTSAQFGGGGDVHAKEIIRARLRQQMREAKTRTGAMQAPGISNPHQG